MKRKSALVTGAASGIGAATAIVVALEGAAVLVCDIDEKNGRLTVDRILATGGTASFFHLDVTKPDSQHAAAREAVRLFGSLDVAVNCAGVSVGPSKTQAPIQDVQERDWHYIIDVNVNGVFYGLQAQVPLMIDNGGGAIVNVASIMSVVARTNLSPYVASKHAVLGLTRAAALDCAAYGIRVNAVGPGYVDTPLLAQKDAETRRTYAALHPLNRMARPEEVAEMIAWLCGSKSEFSTGGYFPVDGGYTAV